MFEHYDDDMLTINLSGFMTCHKDNLVVGWYNKELGMVEIDTTKVSKEDLIQNLLTGTWFILVEKTLRKNEYDNLELDVELAEEEVI